MAGGDFKGMIGGVARELLGEPNKHLSSKTELRWGTNGSLSVDLEKDTFFDHQEKAGGGVLDLIARETGHANGEALDWLRERGFDVGDDRDPQTAGPKQKSRIVCTYDYVDEQGDMVFQVVRFEPKTFRQRRRPLPEDPADKVRDGWVWSVRGIRQVPYRLPDLVEAIALEKTVCIVEGEKDADNLWKLGIPATCNAMGAGKWPASLSNFFVGAEVVILPDNDDPGQAHADLVGASIRDIARVRVLDLPVLPAKGDVSDWIAAGGTAERLYDLIERQARPWGEAPKRLHFGSVWFADAEDRLEEPEWLVDDMLTRGDMSLVYGPSKSGKSFFASHLSLAIARGADVFDRRVRRGGVVYVAAEGKKGFKKRLKAYRIENGIASGARLPFLLVPAAVDMFAKEGDIDKLLADLRIVEAGMAEMETTTELVVFDTYAAISPGANENASEDVTRIVQNCRRVWEVVPHAHIMIVHHKNAAGDKPRGHTSLYAGIDNAIEVTCDEAKNRSARIDKMKDGEDGFSIGFRLQTVQIGTRDDGKPITSCVVVPAQVSEARSGKGPGMSDQQRIALSALREALLDHGEPAPGSLQLPFGLRVVRVEHWKREFLRRGFDETPNDSTFRNAFKRVGEGLLAKGVIGRDQPYVWIAREPSHGSVA